MLYPESKSDQKLIWSMEFWKSFDLEMWRISSRALQLWLPQLWPKTPRLSAAFPLSPQLPWQLRLGHFCHAPNISKQNPFPISKACFVGFAWFCRAGCELFEAIVTCVTSSVPSISHILLFLEGGSLQTFNLRWTHFSWSGKRPMSNKIIMHHANILQQRAATDFEKTWASCRWKHYMHASVCATISLGLYLRSHWGSPPIVVRQYSSAFFPSSWLHCFQHLAASFTPGHVPNGLRPRAGAGGPEVFEASEARADSWPSVSFTNSSPLTLFDVCLCWFCWECGAALVWKVQPVGWTKTEELFLDDDEKQSPSASLTHFLDATRKSAEDLGPSCNISISSGNSRMIQQLWRSLD